MALTRQQIEQEFESELRKNTWWARFIGSQFQRGIAALFANMLLRAVRAAERALQEGFLSYASRRSSVLAGAEDKGHVGRKIAPSTGRVTALNADLSKNIQLPALTTMVAENRLPYTINFAEDQPRSVPPGGKVEFDLQQLEREVVTHVVKGAEPFYRILLSKELSARTHELIVRVEEPGGVQRYEKAFMFRNCDQYSRVYAETYTATEQLGVRFGNGERGRLLQDGWIVHLECWTTAGPTVLMEGAELQLTGEAEALSDVLTLTASTPIIGGAEGETTEQIRAGALYAASYDGQIVWDEDYKFYLRQRIPNLTWIGAWGEMEQEQAEGRMDPDWVNAIFISAYSPIEDQDRVKAKVLAAMAQAKTFNRKFKYIDVNAVALTLTFTGTVKAQESLVTSRELVQAALDEVYGASALERKAEYKHTDIYELISALGVFEDFQFSFNNMPSSPGLADFIYLDVTASTFNLSYPAGVNVNV